MPRSTALLVVGSLLVPGVALAEVRVDVDVNVTIVEPSGEPAPEPYVEPTVEPHIEPTIEPSPAFTRGVSLGREHSVLTRSRWEAELSLEGAPMHGFAMGDVRGSLVGLRASVGRQIGPLRLSLEYGVAKFSARHDLYTSDGWWDGWVDLGGEVSRVGAAVRYRVSAGTERAPHTSLGFYAELGLGRQTIAWTGGGEHTRSDAAFGLGFEIAGGSHHRMGGFDLGVRLIASPKPDTSMDRTHDLSALLQLGVLLGS